MFFRYDIYMPETQGVIPAPQIPSAQEMENQVSQVPQSETAPILDQQTQIAAQTTITPEQQAMNNGIALANTPEVEAPITVVQATVKVADSMVWFKKWAVKLIGIALTLQALHGIYRSVTFILIEYPLLEQQLVSNLITQDQINDYGIRAIMMIISTVLSLFFAMKLTFLKSKAAKTLSTIIAIFLFIGNAMIHDYFVSLNSSQYMIDMIIKGINLIQGAPEDVINNTPFLEESLDGTMETVWYK